MDIGCFDIQILVPARNKKQCGGAVDQDPDARNHDDAERLHRRLGDVLPERLGERAGGAAPT